MSSTSGGTRKRRSTGPRKPGKATNGVTSRRTSTAQSPRPKRSRVPGWVLRGAFICLALLVVAAGWAAIDRKLAPTSNTDRSHFDALIVLGTPADANGNPTPFLLARVNEAVREYERGVAPRIIMTGGAAHSRTVEAEVMARTAEAEGVPESAIVIEGKALDTIQNLCYSTRLMKQHGWSSAEIISSASHLPRAAMIAEGMPLEWRTHAAPPVAPSLVTNWKLDEAVEQLKTMRFLFWARLKERCEP